MCGITGWVGDPPKDTAVIESMTALLHHRGPDDRGIFTSPSAQFGHTRLSILDLSDAGHQPMVLGDLVLTYNGEIYNFRELRGQLEGPFKSDSDTEVLLHLYRLHGDACVSLLRGMFSFAIWDTRRRRLFVARDRLGIKPFLYRKTPDGLAFASELKSLLELGRPSIEDGAINDYLTYRYIPTPNTVFSGIHKLPPAHTLVWEDGRTTIAPYWAPSAEPTITKAGPAIEQLHELLGTVIPEHSISDVPIGVFLSGGIDSAVTAAYLDQPLTVTLASEVPHRNEAPAALEVARHLGTRHFEHSVGEPDLDTALDTITQLFDEPAADSGAWATYTVSSIAREHVTVALTGEGGDELFLGYKRHGLLGDEHLTTLCRMVAQIIPPLTDTGRSLQRRGLTGFERYAELSSGFTRRQKRAILSPRLSGDDHDDLWYFRQHWRPDLEPLAQARWLDLHTYLPDSLLTKVDRAGMAHSLEIRPPLLDHRLVEFALSLHPDLLRSADGTKGKLILRSLMESRLPPGHLDRPKIGFNLPIRRWVRSRPEIYRKALDRLAQADIIRRPKINHLGGEQIWSLLVLDRFLHG